MDSNDSGIKFEEDKWKSGRTPSSFADETPKMAKWLIKISGGAIKDQRQAEYILLGLVAALIAASLFIFFKKDFSVTTKPPLPPEQKALYKVY